MTQPTPPSNPKPVVTVNTLRALLSVAETASFIVAGVLAAMSNGADLHNAVITALVGFMAHGINHNAGGSPV